MRRLIAALVLFYAPSAFADDASFELQRLTTLIERGSQESLRRLHWQMGSGAGVAALGLAGGVVTLSRDANLGSVSLTISSSLGLVANTALLIIAPDPYTRLRETLKRSRETGLSDDETVAAVRQEWRVCSQMARKARVRSGIVQLVMAGLSGAGAVVIAAIPPQHLKIPDGQQSLLVGILSLSSAMNAMTGAIDLTVPRTIERYEELADPSLVTPQVAIAATPVPGGMQLGFALSF